MPTLAFHATRLAPSPTGALHLGHARTFLITWWLARQAGANIFMRMEDLDLSRARPDSIQQAYDDLHWLGIDWDPFPAEPQGIMVQSHRLAAYEAALELLWQRRAIYPCTCTRARIAASVQNAANAPHESDGNVRYPGTCDRPELLEPLDNMTVLQATRAVRDRTGQPVCWRLRVPPKPIAFQDALLGPQSFDVHDQVGDFPLTRFAGLAGDSNLPPAYQLACVVDDHAMAIDLVVRGDDLLSSTPRQMLLYHALGWTAPRFAHVPLVVGPDGKRLAKRHGESRIAQFREAGLPPERIVGWVAWRSGILTEPRIVTAAEALPLFAPHKLPPDRIVVGPADLAWLT